MTEEITLSREALYRALLKVLSPSMATRILKDVEQLPPPKDPRVSDTDRARAREMARRAGLVVK